MSCVFYVLIFGTAQNLRDTGWESLEIGWWVFCTPEKSRLRWCSLTCIKQSRICPSEFCYGRLFSRCACSQGFSSSLHLFSAITIVFRCLSLRGSLVFRHIKQPHPRYSFSSLTASRKMHWFGTLVNGFMWLFGQKYLSTLREKKKIYWNQNQNQVFCQVGCHWTKSLPGILVHNDKHSSRSRK